MNDNLFYKQADLLLSVLPYIKNTDFSLHGGTAINFFIRNMPRISVDIDLTYLKISSRKQTQIAISQQLKKLSEDIILGIPNVKVDKKLDTAGKYLAKLFIKQNNAIVKIEPNQVIRGFLFPCENKEICSNAETLFKKYVSVRTLSFEELYGSKICAALDRQHPRDFFDIILLIKNEGITEKIRKAFLVYLISHNRPISELLNPNFKDMKSAFENEFVGMTSIKINLEELENIRKLLISEINKIITAKEREFLISFKEKQPQWGLLELEGVKNLPAVKWKILNLQKMSVQKHKESLNKLKKIL